MARATTTAARSPANDDAWREGLRAVPRSRDRARREYDRASRWYDLLGEPFERRPRRIGLRLLGAGATG